MTYRPPRSRRDRPRPWSSLGEGRGAGDANVLFSGALRDGLCLNGFRPSRPLFHRRWTARASSPAGLLSPQESRALLRAVPVGGVRDHITWVVPHGHIAGCRIDPEPAYIDDYDLHLHAAATHAAVEKVVSNDAERRFRPCAARTWGDSG
ncbi:hypothetical protein MLGJGCBP_03562 [Rhodococcus sp. T7]|nr:hypothetical protein MLGJGCBP_09504 [Rhodococcus sp. T7]KAF0963256.1 hypothetical protein MLGJGCBP_03562 [Rhodococcus sp. T7]